MRLAVACLIAIGCALPALADPPPAATASAAEKLGMFDAIAESQQIQEHLDRQVRATWMLRWIPWLSFGAAAILALALGLEWERWSAIRLRWVGMVLLGLAIMLPLIPTLSAIYPLFFSFDRPDTGEIAGAIAEAMNCLAFGVLLDLMLLILFLLARAVRTL